MTARQTMGAVHFPFSLGMVRLVSVLMRGNSQVSGAVLVIVGRT